MPVIAFRPRHAAIDAFEQAHHLIEQLALLRRADQYQAPLAAPMRGADIDQQTMPLVGRMQIEQQGLGTRQMKAARQLQPRRQQRVALAQLAQLSIGMQDGTLAPVAGFAVWRDLRQRRLRFTAALRLRLQQPIGGTHIVVDIVAAIAPGMHAALELGRAMSQVGGTLQAGMGFDHIALGKFRFCIDARQHEPGFGQALLARLRQPAHGPLEIGRAVARGQPLAMRIHARIAESQLQLRRAVAAMRGQLATLPSLGIAAWRQCLGATRQQLHLLRIQRNRARPRSGLALQQLARQRQALRQEAGVVALAPGLLQPGVQGRIAIEGMLASDAGIRHAACGRSFLHG